MKTIFQGILNGPPETLEAVLTTFMCLVDSPTSRAFLRPNVEIEVSKLT